MRHWNMQLGCGKRSGQSGVRVAVDHEPRWTLLEQDVLELFDHPSRVLTVTSTANAQVIVRGRKLEFFKENIGHIGVIVLPRMDQYLVDVRARAPERTGDHRRLDEMRSSAYDRDDLQGAPI